MSYKTQISYIDKKKPGLWIYFYMLTSQKDRQQKILLKYIKQT